MGNHFALFDDCTLWRELKSGNTSAFSIIFKQYRKVLFNYGRKFTSDFDLIEDCIQDLFLEILEKKQILSDTDSIKFYLYKGLRRRLTRCELNQSRLGERIELAEDFHFGIASCYETELIDQQVQVERLQILTSALAVLSKRQKQVLQLRYYNNCSYPKIADMMRIDINSVYKLVSSALKEVKRNYVLPVAA